MTSFNPSLLSFPHRKLLSSAATSMGILGSSQMALRMSMVVMAMVIEM